MSDIQSIVGHPAAPNALLVEKEIARIGDANYLTLVLSGGVMHDRDAEYMWHTSLGDVPVVFSPWVPVTEFRLVEASKQEVRDGINAIRKQAREDFKAGKLKVFDNHDGTVDMLKVG